ncbi:2-keto-4-pentenoate hydratase (plasmid) [Nicoliella spurrieriana]|uniref:2-keto-4-pentenoate hydratase n=1 Tax=Nicoliella spurrieriana TaxID=2925830 RepID=A0A976X4Y3_9LACO|nr:2-keto-4-pentenoate hydratase [Nicoliella spurrieriana]UQS86041.1 2-keto-4-pentenoate hydratase [Nicoliella spurrieriana]
MSKNNVDEVSNSLVLANEDRHSLAWQPFKAMLNDESDGYSVQELVYNALNGENNKVAAYKVSLTSEKSQKGYNYNQPIFGKLSANQLVLSGGTVVLNEQFKPFLEVEVAFKVNDTLLPGDDLTTLLSKVDALPAFELPDSRFRDWFRKLSKELFMADDAMANLLVVGKSVATTDLNPLDLADVTMELEHDGNALGQSKSSSVLGNPLNSLKWLVEKLDNSGNCLTKGQFVTTGTSKTVDLAKGSWRANFSKGLGFVTLNVK